MEKLPDRRVDLVNEIEVDVLIRRLQGPFQVSGERFCLVLVRKYQIIFSEIIFDLPKLGVLIDTPQGLVPERLPDDEGERLHFSITGWVEGL